MTAGLAVPGLVLGCALLVRRGLGRRRRTHLRSRLATGHPSAPFDHREWLGRMGLRIDSLLHARDPRVERELPPALEGIARSLRSGSSIPQAVAEAAARARGPLADDLARVDRLLTSGVPLEEALESWAMTRSTPGVRLTAAALRLSSRLGGSGARAVDRLARSLRDRHAVQRELAALAAQAKISAAVILLAPLAFGALGLVVDGRTAHFLLATPVGLGCLSGAVVLDLAALLWMRRIVAGVPG